jgi:RimJ/RimL family protein N-acetyltransferase
MIITKVALKNLGDLRTKFLAEIDNQFTYDKCHLYGWADTWLFTIERSVAGYGAVWGKEKREDRDSIMEFFLEPEFRKDAHAIFAKFRDACGATWIESQSNDPFLSEMLFEFATGIYAEAILFEDDFTSSISFDHTKLVSAGPSDNQFDRSYLLKYKGEVVGSGGLLLNYNFPYADIYYAIDEPHRRKGFGSFFVQELKKAAYNMGRVPAARTNIDNMISKRTMMKAGLKPCGWRLGGKITRMK